MRTPIVAANWKMNKTCDEARRLAVEVLSAAGSFGGVEVVLCPPFTALAAVGTEILRGPLALGAQNLHWAGSGAYTGEISPPMLVDLGCRYVIVGHSERRAMFNEDDAEINRKARAALDAGLRPIICVGETLEQREAGETEAILERQVRGSLAGLGDRLPQTVVAYEPVWAIGTGRTATAEQAQTAHSLIREVIAETSGASVARQLRIQYGGSVKPENAAKLFSQADVDGGLIGGASLSGESFAAIVRAART